MPAEHIVKSFDEALRRLNQTIQKMGGRAEEQIAAAIAALEARDSEAAAKVVAADAAIDAMERDIDEQVVRLLALRQPMASDLRLVIGSLRIAIDLERIADYAKNIAKRGITLAQVAPVRPAHAIPRMGRFVQMLIKDVLDAYAARDVEKAVAAWNRDEELDEMYSSLFRELLTYMMEDPRNITGSTHLLFIAKNLERIGDHATNVAETVHFLVTGKAIDHARPKSDDDVNAMARPAGTAP